MSVASCAPFSSSRTGHDGRRAAAHGLRMRRWNGWGDDSVHDELPPAGVAAIERAVGRGTPPLDATLADVVGTLPGSRLPRIGWSPPTRGSGSATPAGRACRTGSPCAPGGSALSRTASLSRTTPRGPGAAGLGRVRRGPGHPLRGRDERRRRGDTRRGRCAVADAIPRPPLRPSRARRRQPARDVRSRGGARPGGPPPRPGLTLGHYPQWLELSTLGGWVAARSGQQSTGYGRIERLFAGGRWRRRPGRWSSLPFPASAAGPDLREAVLGSEGRFGIVTEATVRISPLPEVEEFPALFFPDWDGARVRRASSPRRASRSRWSASRRPTRPGRHSSSRGTSDPDGARPISLVPRGGTGSCLVLLGLVGRRRLAADTFAEVLAIGRGVGAVGRRRRSGASGRRTASGRPTSGTHCGRRGTPSTRSRRRSPGSGSRRWRPRSHRPPPRAPRRGRAGARLHPPLPRLRRRHEPLHDLPLPPGRRPGRDARRWQRLKAAATEAIVRAAARSATSTASGATTPGSSPRRRGSWASRQSPPWRDGSTRRGSSTRESSCRGRPARRAGVSTRRSPATADRRPERGPRARRPVDDPAGPVARRAWNGLSHDLRRGRRRRRDHRRRGGPRAARAGLRPSSSSRGTSRRGRRAAPPSSSTAGSATSPR